MMSLVGLNDARVTLDGCLGTVDSLINKHGHSAIVAAEPGAPIVTSFLKA